MLNRGLRFLVAPLMPISSTMIGNTLSLLPLRSTTLSKRILNATHATAELNLQIFKDAGVDGN